MREQSNQENQGGTLQQRIRAMGNKKSYPVSLAPPFHPKSRQSHALRTHHTLQGGFMLLPTYEIGIGGHGTSTSPGCSVSAIFSTCVGAERVHLRHREQFSADKCMPTTPGLILALITYKTGWLNSGKSLQIHKLSSVNAYLISLLLGWFWQLLRAGLDQQQQRADTLDEHFGICVALFPLPTTTAEQVLHPLL